MMAADPELLEELRSLAKVGFFARHLQIASLPWQFAIWRALWSKAQFGDRGPLGPLRHLELEVKEAIAKPGDIFEYADLLHLVLDASVRAGFTLESLLWAAMLKLEKNILREWPEAVGDEPTEHVRRVR